MCTFTSVVRIPAIMLLTTRVYMRYARYVVYYFSGFAYADHGIYVVIVIHVFAVGVVTSIFDVYVVDGVDDVGGVMFAKSFACIFGGYDSIPICEGVHQCTFYVDVLTSGGAVV